MFGSPFDTAPSAPDLDFDLCINPASAVERSIEALRRKPRPRHVSIRKALRHFIRRTDFGTRIKTRKPIFTNTHSSRNAGHQPGAYV